MLRIVGKIAGSITTKHTVKVRELKTDSNYTVILPEGMYFPIVVGDVVALECDPTDEDHIVRYLRTVHIVMGRDKNTTVSLLIRALPRDASSGKKVYALFDYLEKALPSYKCECVNDLLSYLSEATYKSKEDPPESVVFLCAAKMAVNGRPRPLLKREEAMHLLNWWTENFDMRRLYCLGLTFKEIDDAEMRPYELYKKIVEGPYSVPGISIQKCGDLSEKVGYQPRVYDEDYGKILRAVYENAKKRKWSCTPVHIVERNYSKLTEEDRRILTADFDLIFVHVPFFDTTDTAVPDYFEERVYYKPFYEHERRVTDFLVSNIQRENTQYQDPVFFDDELDEWQRSAVSMVMRENVSVLCGPAGSGKTRTLRTIIQNFELQGLRTVVTSFTGKAVIRARQLNGIGKDAATMHRIIYGSGPQEFDVVIFEESSMISTSLLSEFIKKFEAKKYRVLFVGDPNQLPPIDWGFCFSEMIKSRSIPRVELKAIHRVKTKDGKDDGIIQNTTRICTWPADTDFLFKKAENFMVCQGGPAEIFDLIEQHKNEGGRPEDLTILSPYKTRTINGEKFEQLLKLNQISQLIWNGQSRFMKGNVHDPRVWRVGDRVMVNKNVYDGIEIFNGQEGIVTDVAGDHIEVVFETGITQKTLEDGTIPKIEHDNKNVTVVITSEIQVDENHILTKYNEIVRVPLPTGKKGKATLKVYGHGDEGSGASLSTLYLDLCYAMTIHKSQGSEWKKVVVTIPSDAPTNGSFLNRNMQYTAMTRASETLINVDPCGKLPTIIGKRLPWRCESLSNFLMEKLERLEEYVEFKLEEVDCGQAEDMDDMDFW
jgi:hypothetical protein